MERGGGRREKGTSSEARSAGSARSRARPRPPAPRPAEHRVRGGGRLRPRPPRAGKAGSPRALLYVSVRRIYFTLPKERGVLRRQCLGKGPGCLTEAKISMCPESPTAYPQLNTASSVLAALATQKMKQASPQCLPRGHLGDAHAKVRGRAQCLRQTPGTSLVSIEWDHEPTGGAPAKVRGRAQCLRQTPETSLVNIEWEPEPTGGAHAKVRGRAQHLRQTPETSLVSIEWDPEPRGCVHAKVQLARVVLLLPKTAWWFL
ncbi:hypothetical protein NDU88_007916 [Pleurodeles waltl]|uniref:Uncharacterized protein n=1 Tax=Pleurodeles waltl TaxID=8319 RepID=A0AAV7U1S8_PLEWA|nr:hypothetical protein NDU88_007916 [Pleurodeles waltl]